MFDRSHVPTLRWVMLTWDGAETWVRAENQFRLWILHFNFLINAEPVELVCSIYVDLCVLNTQLNRYTCTYKSILNTAESFKGMIYLIAPLLGAFLQLLKNLVSRASIVVQYPLQTYLSPPRRGLWMPSNHLQQNNLGLARTFEWMPHIQLKFLSLFHWMF